MNILFSRLISGDSDRWLQNGNGCLCICRKLQLQIRYAVSDFRESMSDVWLHFSVCRLSSSVRSRPHTTTCIPSAYQPAIPGILPILPIVSLRGICSAHVVAHIPRRPRAISGFYRLPKSHIACELGMSERQSPSSAFCRLKTQRSMVASDASV